MTKLIKFSTLNSFALQYKLINIGKKKENEEMAKLTGYQSVAVVELGSGCCKKRLLLCNL